MTPWLVHELRNKGLNVVCLDARHARAALKMQVNKTDQNDAEGLAQIMRTGWYRLVHVKSYEAHRARALLAARSQLVGMTTRLLNHIRGVLKTFGLLPGTMRDYRPIAASVMLDNGPTCPIVRPRWPPGGSCASNSTFDKAITRLSIEHDVPVSNEYWA
jgi:transposase